MWLFINFVVVSISKSPFHPLISNSILVLKVKGEKDGEEIFDTGKLLPVLKAAVSLCYRPSQYLVEEPDIGRRNRDPVTRKNA